VLEAGLEPEMMFDEGQKVFQFIVSHLKKYSTMPTAKTVRLETGIKLYKAGEKIDFYIDKIRSRHIGNSMSKELRGVIKALEADPYAALNRLTGIEHRVMSATGSSDGVVDITSKNQIAKRKRLYAAKKAFKGGIDGIKSPWPSLDDRTLGWHPGEVIVIVGKKGSGKSWMMNLFAMTAWQQKKKCLTVTIEMPEEQMSMRFDSMAARISHQDIRKGQVDGFAEKKFEERLKEMEENDTPVFMADSNAVRRVEDLERLIIAKKPDVVFLDGLYILGWESKSNLWERVTRNMTALKMIALRTATPIIATTQFSRKQKRGSLDGDDDDISYSDAIGQFADIILALFSDEAMERTKRRLIRTIKSREFEPIELIVNWDMEKSDYSEVGVVEDKSDRKKLSSSPKNDPNALEDEDEELEILAF
jgi:replicative DNA helicase